MGTFPVGCLIKNHVDRQKWVKIPRLRVDPGSDATWIARQFLEQIEIKAEKRRAFRMASGQWVYRDVGYAIIRVGQRETSDEVVFAEKGDDMLFGGRALEGLMLWVDSANKKLIEIEAEPSAKVVVPAKSRPTKTNPCSPARSVKAKGDRQRGWAPKRAKKSGERNK